MSGPVVFTIGVPQGVNVEDAGIFLWWLDILLAKVAPERELFADLKEGKVFVTDITQLGPDHVTEFASIAVVS